MMQRQVNLKQLIVPLNVKKYGLNFESEIKQHGYRYFREFTKAGFRHPVSTA